MPARTAPRATAEQPCSRPPRAFLELGALLTAPGCARAWTREILWERGLAELADTVEIVVSGLVTNSVNASRALSRPVIWLILILILTLGRGDLAILVRDGHPGAPQVRRPSAEDESGSRPAAGRDPKRPVRLVPARRGRSRQGRAGSSFSLGAGFSARGLWWGDVRGL